MRGLALISIVSLMSLSACASDAIMEPKAMPDNWHAAGPALEAPVQVASLAPAPRPGDSSTTSLWSSSPKSLFGDRRASQFGDILTVVIEIDDEAEMTNSTAQNRSSDQDFSLGAFFGLPEILNRQLPENATVSPAVDITRSSAVSGTGNIKREEKLTLRLAARVTDVLPNGYLGLSGRQEIMVNNERRYLQVTGLVRTQDISRLNTITYDKIAEARIYYGGDGQISNAVKTKRGNKVLDKIIPF